MIGFASLLSKGLRFSSEIISRRFQKLGSGFTGTVGGRNLGRNTVSAGPTMLLIALTISLAWNNVLIATTLPHTGLNQARFAIGGDVVFTLDDDYESFYTELKQNTSILTNVRATSIVTVHGLSLSSRLYDTIDFALINPSEYSQVGYDSFGISLIESSLQVMLDRLENEPSGAVITADVATAYALVEGDTLRAFRSKGMEIETVSFGVLGIVDSIPDSMATLRGYNPPQSETVKVGRERIWINKEFSQAFFDNTTILGSYLCVSVNELGTGSEVVDYVNSNGAEEIIIGYSVASEYADSLVKEDNYVLDRSIDTLLSILVLSLIPGIFALYFADNSNKRHRDGTLLRVLGAKSKNIHSAQVVEILLLVVHSTVLLFLCIPFLIQNSLYITIVTSNVLLTAYPEPILPVVPWSSLLMLLILVSLVASVVTFINTSIDMRRDLTEAKNVTWKEGMPSRGGV